MLAGRTMAIMITLSGVGGCHSWRPAAAEPRNRAEVLISFREPRDVMAATTPGDSVRIPGARQLRGSVVRAVPETLYVRVVAVPARRGISRQKYGVVAVTRASDVTVSEHVVSKKKTFLLAGTTVLTLGLVALALATADWSYDYPTGY
jgi:hypothetical protein